jgi:hypothetical protein
MENNYENLKNELKEISKVLKEFPEILQSQVYEILISTFQGRQVTHSEVQSKEKPENPIITKSKTEHQSKKKKGTTSKESYTIVKSLDLKGSGKIPSFQDFCSDKDISSAIKFNVISIYYLRKHMKIDNVDLNHIYTCYKEMKKPLPNNLKQSIYDTSGPKYGYIDAANISNLKIPTSGENYVEHVLIKKPKK